MKALLDLFKQVTAEEEFDAITIGLASPDKVRLVLYGEVKSQKPSITGHSPERDGLFCMPRFWPHQGLRMPLRQVQTPQASWCHL